MEAALFGSFMLSLCGCSLGIHHAAIVVAKTAASVRCYCDMLGFRVVGGSENRGIEPENLNDAGGAHLRITTLRTATGPAIELPEYLNPRDAAGLAGMLRSAGERFVTAFGGGARREAPGDHEAYSCHDPDGHALRIIRP